MTDAHDPRVKTPSPSARRGVEDKEAGYDPECVLLCRALNALPGITTTESCCGHNRKPYWIWFRAASLSALPAALYYFDACHGGRHGWRVVAKTDCARQPVLFIVEGPKGAYAAADSIAQMILTEMS